MGCWTGYVVREASGEVRTSGRKGGAYEVQGTRELDGLVAYVRESAGPVLWGASWCCGLYVDLAAREVRFYGCEPGLREIDAALARVRRALGTAYRVSYAWEGCHELAWLAGDPCEPEIAPSDERDAIERLGVASPEVEGLRWDPVTRTLHYPWSAFTGAAAWVTIIAEDGRVHDIGLDASQALAYLLASGPVVLTRLLAEIPTPLPLVLPYEHAIFDMRARRVSLWSPKPCVARAGWEGWSFERLVTDIDDHLARTGRRLDEKGLVVAHAPGDLRPVVYTPHHPG